MMQFFTIPLGYFLGGLLTDKVFEPFMESSESRTLTFLFENGKGSGTAFLFFIIGIAGVVVCLLFRKIKVIYELDENTRSSS